jgi:hypothetical protein
VRWALYAALLLACLHAQPRPHAGFVYPAGARQGETVTVLIGGQLLEGISNIYVSGGDIAASLVAYNIDYDPFFFGNLLNSKRITEGRLSIAQVVTTNVVTNTIPRLATNRVAIGSTDPDPVGATRFFLPGTSNLVVVIATNALVVSKEFITNQVTNTAYTIAPLTLTNLTRLVGTNVVTRMVTNREEDGTVSVVVEHTNIETVRFLTNLSQIIGTNEVTNTATNARGVVTVTVLTNIGAVMVTNLMATNMKAQLERQLDRLNLQVGWAEPAPTDPDLMRYMQAIRPKKQPNAQIQERVRIQLTIPSNTQPGRRELRLATRNGYSEPLGFWVGDLPEVLEREPNDLTNQSQILPELPIVVNGQILPGDVDHFRFQAKRGQNVVCRVQARELIPYLADAVPGWFKVVLTLYDPVGREIAYADDFFQNPDPILACVIPSDGVYTLKLIDSIYRGREDFVYRITVGAVPVVTGVFPLGGPRTGSTWVNLQGHNLPTNQVVVRPAADDMGIISFTPVPGSPPVLFYADDLPETGEIAGRHDRAASAQTLSLPVVVNGRCEGRGEVDYYRFEGRAGDRVVAEIHARRVGSPLDSVLRLQDARGATLALSDDWVDRMAGLVTHQADSYIDTVLANDGAYVLSVRDAQGRGGPLFSYRLRLSAPRPDFKLRISPSSLRVPKGGTVAATLWVQRDDGFTNAIDLEVEAGSHFCLVGGRVPPSTHESVRFTLTVATNAPDPVVLPSIYGVSTLDDRVLRHRALASEDMMQAFAYRHLVPADDLVLGLAAPIRLGLMAVLSNDFVPLPLGKQVRVPVRQLHGPYTDGVLRGIFIAFDLDQPPKGIYVNGGAVAATNVVPYLTLRTDTNAQIGQAGNLIVNVSWVNTRTGQRSRMCTMPALPYQVVGPN